MKNFIVSKPGYDKLLMQCKDGTIISDYITYNQLKGYILVTSLGCLLLGIGVGIASRND